MVNVTEEFDNKQGQLQNYDVPPSYDLREQLLDRKHVNIRSFMDPILVEGNMMLFSALTIDDLEGLTMEELSNLDGPSLPLRSGDDWQLSAGTSLAVVTVAGRKRLRLVGEEDTIIASSVVAPSLFDFPGSQTTHESIDLLTGFTDTDHISVALPNFPLASIDPDESSLTLTSSEDGDFNEDFVTVPFTGRLVGANPNWELRIPRSAFSAIDLSRVTGIRFTFAHTGTVTIDIAAIRLLSENWESFPYDIETWRERLEPTVNRVGTTTFDNEWPGQLLRSNTPSNQDDPRPVDTTMAVAFHSGSLTIEDNSITLFFRERLKDLMTQLDLEPLETRVNDIDGITASNTTITVDSTTGFATAGIILIDQEEITYTGITATTFTGCTRGTDGTTAVAHPDNSKVYQGFWQDQLGEIQDQPNFIEGGFTGRPQSELDVLQQDELDELTQSILERVPDLTWQTYIYAKLTWDANSASLEVSDTETPATERYLFTAIHGIQPNRDYLFVGELVENSFRAWIYELESNGMVKWNTPLFDSTLIRDDYMLKRRKGRVGWTTTLINPDAALWGIRVRHINFAEYRSQVFESITPVKGAELTVEAIPDTQLFTGFSAAPWGGNVEVDTSRSNSNDGSFKIVNDGLRNLQGIQSNPLLFENFRQAEITFDVWFPSSAFKVAPLEAFLLHNESRIFRLGMEPLHPNNWSSVRLRLDQAESLQTGSYRLVLAQVQAVPTNWWIDNVRVIQRGIGWFGRARQGSAQHPGAWMPFENLVNTPGDGIVFPERGRELQIRGQAYRQDAFISSLSVKPHYAQLGRLVWEDQKPSIKPSLIPSFDFSTNGRTITTVPSVTDPSNEQIAQVWSFGDGQVSHELRPVHTFADPGTYRVTFMAIDRFGREAVATQDITIT